MNFVAIIIITSFAAIAIVFFLNLASFKDENLLKFKPQNQKITKNK